MTAVGASIVRLLSMTLTTYLILWMNSFSDKKIIEASEGKSIYQNIILISAILSAILYPVIGVICDKADPMKIVPFAFIFRFLTMILFEFVSTPKSAYQYFVTLAIVVASLLEQISVDCIFNKNLPKETRGMFNGFYSVMVVIFVLIYSSLSGYAIDKYENTKWPFYILGGFDLIFAMCFVGMRVMKKI